MSTTREQSPNGVYDHARAYRCKKCRRIVALHENVMDHTPGEGETAFEWYKRRSGNRFNKPDESECSSIFIEPLRWMKAGKELSTLFYFFQNKKLVCYGIFRCMVENKTISSIAVIPWSVFVHIICFFKLRKCINLALTALMKIFPKN